MQKLYEQMSLFDTYTDVCSALDEDKPKLIQLLEEHIILEDLIPMEFYVAFYSRWGRPRKYCLESFIWFLLLQKIIGIHSDSTLLTILILCRELRELCGFDKVPDASKITRFRQAFVDYINLMFDRLVDITEPICREIDAKKADYLIYDTSGIEAYVAENNPKFLNTKLNNAKKVAKKSPAINPYAFVYSLLPETSKANPYVKQQYINGHFCYAFKTGILTNGLGIMRDIAFFDESFKSSHPEVVSKKTNNPNLDKEVGDSISLRPVLSDFFAAHSNFSYGTFLGDSAFDSYDLYAMLRDKFNFERVVIPLNARNSSFAKQGIEFDDNGTPVCPIDKTPFTYLGVSGGKNRSQRFKYVCHKSVKVAKSSKRFCTCEAPCTDSSYGRCVYTYPAKNFRIYPGLPRGSKHWNYLYRHRVLIERSINLLKDSFGVAVRKSYSHHTAKADLLFAGITQLVGVILANAIHKPHLYNSIRRLTA
jgi:Transposase domain (DUF772).